MRWSTLALLRLFVAVVCLSIGVTSFKITSSIHGVTPHRTATTRRIGVGDDTITSVHLAMHNGQVIYANIAHHGKMHQGKKNGGRIYHRHINLDAEIPDHLDHVVYACALINMADPNSATLVQLAKEMTMGLTPIMKKEDIIDDVSFRLPTIDLPFLRLNANDLVKRLTNQFRNADGPVWFSSMVVRNPASYGHGHVWDGTKTDAGLKPPAVYEVIWKVTRH